MENSVQQSNASRSRRSFLRKGLAVGGAGAIGAGLASCGLPVFAQTSNTQTSKSSSSLSQGDTAILRFLAAAEIIESDLWLQYNELGGIQDDEVPGGSGNAIYTAALKNLDGDMDQYIHDNTEDEFSHHAFLNAYLQFIGARPVDLSRFATL